MQDNIQDEVRRIENISHEIIEALRTELEQEIDETKQNVLNKNLVRLAIKYRDKVKCGKCFLKTTCNEAYYCTETVMNYLKGVEHE